jgi:hypothetical protein
VLILSGRILDGSLRQRERRSGFGHVGNSEAERLKFIAAAEHALACGRRNQAGMFAVIVRRGLWSFLSLHDEDRARKRAQEVLVPPSSLVRRRTLPRCSASAEVVRALIARSLQNVEGQGHDDHGHHTGNPPLVRKTESFF